MKPKTLEESIYFTISYFDVFSYPPTFFEVWRYLFYYKAELDQVITKLDEMIRTGKIEMKNGFYFLPEKSDLLEKRAEKYDISEKFWNRAVFASKILTYLPFIKAILVVNSLALFNCDEKSDIDFLIITTKRKIWTSRALSSTLLHILGLRRHGKKIAKRICTSFYISEEKLNLDYIAQDEFDFFVAFWLSQSTPLISKEKVYKKFRNQNDWIYRILPNASLNITDYYINYRHPLFSKAISRVLEFIFTPNFIENIARFIQMKKIEDSQKKWVYPKSVIYNDYILKFHPEDLRIKYKEDLFKKLHKL